jgi:hypothetical protein
LPTAPSELKGPPTDSPIEATDPPGAKFEPIAPSLNEIESDSSARERGDKISKGKAVMAIGGRRLSEVSNVLLEGGGGILESVSHVDDECKG